MRSALALGVLFAVVSTSASGLSQDLESEVITAVRRAYSLEVGLFADPSRIKSREDVYRHYRQGFSEEISQRLTDYSWWSEKQTLRFGDKAMAVPAKIILLESSEDHAVVAYRTPEPLRETWGLGKYSVDRLRRENGRWVIAESKSTDEPPPGFEEPAA